MTSVDSVMDLDSARTQTTRHSCQELSCLGYWGRRTHPMGSFISLTCVLDFMRRSVPCPALPGCGFSVTSFCAPESLTTLAQWTTLWNCELLYTALP